MKLVLVVSKMRDEVTGKVQHNRTCFSSFNLLLLTLFVCLPFLVFFFSGHLNFWKICVEILPFRSQKLFKHPILQSTRMFFWWELCKLPPEHWYFGWQFESSKLQPVQASCLVHLVPDGKNSLRFSKAFKC